MARLSRLVQRIHFEDFGGVEFERLVFAYHVRAGWTDVAWYGQTGSDNGRDIVGNEPLADGTFREAVIQCVNRDALSQAKAEQDMDGAVAASLSKPAFKFVVRGKVSATRRDAVLAAAKLRSITHMTIWAGVEFEENLHLIAPDLLRRFCDGESFPDEGADLRRFADDFIGLSDDDALAQMAAVFDRPAFRTPFQQESSIPAFHHAIEDTLAAQSVSRLIGLISGRFEEVSAFGWLEQMADIAESLAECIEGSGRLLS
ncbi:restriction endonuclease [Mesorhizobium cantuariense]|uniref:Restriction endonuclease n=1 Tax=Mesorhizobium cantuariense TaxID=1300275 RepID=A0ABV7MNS4_9HYPH